VDKVKEYLASIGSKGGKATGKAKVRGDTDYYRAISAKAAQARKEKAVKWREFTGTGAKQLADAEAKRLQDQGLVVTKTRKSLDNWRVEARRASDSGLAGVKEGGAGGSA
jgi:hypothetical protein